MKIIKYKYYPPGIYQPDFKNPLVWKDLKRKCFDGSINYENFPANEYKYFDKLRILYLKFQSNMIGHREAEQEERLIYNSYVRERERSETGLRTHRIYNKNRLRLNGLKISINKAETPEEKLKFALELISQLTDDELFVKINRR